ncbi:protein-glutamine gamma-glutamyltransferase K-like [Diadema setosum]|uniref:protein-glutamine gamma-glutamyltransferase K-like n=1 Tax=Diadema setosum TaxID=31175 RepID=UPI003B3A3A21
MVNHSSADADYAAPGSPGRSIDVEAAEREYLGEPGTEAPPRADQLVVAKVNYELERNRRNHHTTEYESEELFVRRGQAFDIDVTFNKAPKTEELALELSIRGAKVSSINRGTIVRIPFNRSHHVPGDWSIQVGSVEGAKYSLVVSCPADAMVGRYEVAIIIVDKLDAEPRFFKQSPLIYVVFNPWCAEDFVFMNGEDEKKEYVLNESGFVFTGTARRGQQWARPWIFGQFEESVIKVIFDLLEKHTRDGARRDPVVVSRKFTGLINYMPVWGREETKTGVLIGNWSGDYEDGVSPSKWTGSTKIYEQYAATREPVKYGQCWVFSGVLNTAMRCLGIPSRSVTNFSSAHDTDNSMTIDMVYDADSLEEVEYLSNDSVWNFHVWNEVWMARPDLIEGMGGWQVVDATPQETSEGIFQTGPAPKMAIKQGLTYLNYDTKFCFAEVNADRITWIAKKTGRGKPDMKVFQIDKNAVGKYISTTRVSSVSVSRWNAREDITHEYKFEEGGDEERMAVERAVSFGTRPNTYGVDEQADKVEMEIVLAERIPVGEDFDVAIKFNNKSSVERHMKLVFNAHICYYTGVQAKKLQSEKADIQIPSGISEKKLGTILAERYAPSLVDQTIMKICVFGKVQETSQQVVAQDSIQLTPPELSTKVEMVGSEVELVTEFDNPLPIPLTKCSITFEGARTLSGMTLYPNDVPAKGHFSQRVRFKPRSKGKKTLLIDFDSKQLANVTDMLDIEIP